jgi:hypothetical protein
MKTTGDLTDFAEFRAAPHVHGIRRSRRNGAVVQAKRMFLRAYVRSAWGLDLDARAMSYAELAQWLTNGGYPTSKADVENANRPSAKLVEHVVSKGVSVERFVEFIRSKFPSFDAHRLYAP